jgi:hypothetical protein
MWARASLESAQRYLTTLRRAAARVRTRHLAKVFGRVVAVLFCLQIAYLAVGNAILKSQLIQRAVETSEGFHLSFEDAYTLWPGHVRVRNLSLRVEDYNVQFEVALARADVDIALGQLPFKKFHVTRLESEGTRFRMRHKLIAVGDDAERVAAYPKIQGFADPPYFVGVDMPPLSDADYDLWQVRIENVHARVSELWVMEYRFQGAGVARGSFVVKPERWVQVELASLVLERGRLTLGEHVVADSVHGRLTCDIPDMQVQETDGLEVLREISASVKLTLANGRLDFLQAYLARFGSARYAGNAEWLLDLNVTHGVVQRGSRVSLRATPLRVEHELSTLSGDAMLSFGRDDARDELVLAVGLPRVEFTGRPGAAPVLEGVSGSQRFAGVDLRKMELGAGALSIERMHAASLAWFSSSLHGSANGSFVFSRQPSGALAGQARFDATRAGLSNDDLAATADWRGELAFRRGAGGVAIELSKLSVWLSDARVRSGTKRSKAFSASFDGAGLRVRPEELGATGDVRLHVSSAEALLPLFVGEPLRSVSASALDLKGLEARASVDVSRRSMELTLIDARSGNLRLRGHVTGGDQEPRGQLLVSSGPINVGVTLRAGSTEVSPFVSDSWLARAPGAG